MARVGFDLGTSALQCKCGPPNAWKVNLFGLYVPAANKKLISLLPILSKIIERLPQRRAVLWLFKKKYPNQYQFIKVAIRNATQQKLFLYMSIYQFLKSSWLYHPPPAVSIKHLMPGHERETVNFVSFSDLLYGWKFWSWNSLNLAFEWVVGQNSFCRCTVTL